jgi:hypothetical protein
MRREDQARSAQGRVLLQPQSQPEWSRLPPRTIQGTTVGKLLRVGDADGLVGVAPSLKVSYVHIFPCVRISASDGSRHSTLPLQKCTVDSFDSVTVCVVACLRRKRIQSRLLVPSHVQGGDLVLHEGGARRFAVLEGRD